MPTLKTSISANYESIGYKSAKYLILKGCKNIGLINGNMELIPYKNRYYGYKKALSEYGYKENVIELFENKIDYLRNGYDSAISLIENNPNIDGILTSTDMQGIGVIRALKEKIFLFLKK
ncbi:substrate-binding domain-containing protein [uncultured Brachyspira sp.]|uniref:substrate-binding domain-containing protein n=1 Tax=uncultured Brachyspira sp. TaxID=221953 RepID=UPI0027DB4D11|nr:substrate-binding domain-containing protein [uncultured Brachyspira sp.]